MRTSIDLFLKKIIHKSTKIIIEREGISSNEPIEFYLDDIFLETLTQCANQLPKIKTLRNIERHTLNALSDDIRLGVNIRQIESNLYKNLSQIKPVCGELFGTNRGLIYNIFTRLINWNCFKPSTRFMYKQQHFTQIITLQSKQLNEANQIIQHQKSVNQSLTQHSVSQLLTIQKLKGTTNNKNRRQHAHLNPP